MSVFDMLSSQQRGRLKREGFPDWTSPMLAVLTEDYFSDPDWIFERKFDGVRALAFCKDGRATLMSRNRHELNDTYPELQDALIDRVSSDCVLDGEIVAFDGAVTSFSRLQGRMQIRDRQEALASGIPVFFYLFDVLYCEGLSCEGVPLRSRKKLLKRLVQFKDPIRYTSHRNKDGEAYLSEACEKRWEGVIAKRAESHYVHGRSKDWLKFKCSHGQELVIGGYTRPKGTRICFGALLTGYYTNGEFRYAGKVGTGFDEDTLRRIHGKMSVLERKTSPFSEEVREKDVTWVKPELVGEFGFTEWTRSGKLRHPRFLGLRDDKKASAVVREGKG